MQSSLLPSLQGLSPHLLDGGVRALALLCPAWGRLGGSGCFSSGVEGMNVEGPAARTCCMVEPHGPPSASLPCSPLVPEGSGPRVAAALRGRGDYGRGLHPCTGQRLPGNPQPAWSRHVQACSGLKAEEVTMAALSLGSPHARTASGILNQALGASCPLSCQPLLGACSSVYPGMWRQGGWCWSCPRLCVPRAAMLVGGCPFGGWAGTRTAQQALGLFTSPPSLRVPVPEDRNSVLFFRVSPEPSLGQGPKRGREVSAGLTGYGSIGVLCV